VRLVTHLDVTSADLDAVIAAVKGFFVRADKATAH